MLVVTFLRTVVSGGGQEKVGRIVYDGSTLIMPANLRLLLDRDLYSLDQDDAVAVREWLAQLPARFDGAYLRASLVGA